jgi:hypothetical protein
MSYDDADSCGSSRRLGSRLSAVAWLVTAFILADSLAVANSLWWHSPGTSSSVSSWRLLPHFFLSAWDDSVERGNVDIWPLALASSQASLLVLWACLGRRRWVLRWSAAAVGLGYCTTVLAAVSASSYQPSQAQVLFAAQATTIIVWMASLRIRGWRLSTEPTATNADRTARRRVQFDTRDLIAATAIVAALIWLAPNLLIDSTLHELQRAFSFQGATFWPGDPRPHLAWMAASGTACGLVALLGAWLLLRRGTAWLHLIIFGFASWAIARIAILSYIDFNIYARQRIEFYTEPGPRAAYETWFCLQAAMLALALVAVRRGGRQLEKGALSQGGDSANSSRTSVRGALGYSVILLIVLSALTFDEVVSRFAGDRELRRTAAAINSGFGERVSAFCFWRSFNWPLKGPPAVGARFKTPADAAVIAKLRADHSPEGLWFEGEIGAPAWNEVLQSPDLRLLVVMTNGQGPQITDRRLEQLTKLSGLLRLELTSAEVSDAGLNRLAKLPNLESIHLDCPRITREGEAEFRRLRPRVGLWCVRTQ